jgi:hypothetical protein
MSPQLRCKQNLFHRFFEHHTLNRSQGNEANARRLPLS